MSFVARCLLAVLICLHLLLSGCAAQGEVETTPMTSQDESHDEATSTSDTLHENQIRVFVGEASFVVTLEDNESARALQALLVEGDMTIAASNYGGFEKVCPLGTTLPSSDEQTTTQAGDVMLYSGDQIVFFYDSNSWAYTRIGHVDELSAEELREILDGPETEITLSIH